MPAIYTKHIRYLLLPLLLLLLLAQIAIAQNPQIDSLVAVLNEHKEEDTTKINLLNNLSKLYHRTSEYALAMEKAEQAAAIAEKIGFKHGLAASYNNIGNIYDYQGEYPKALENYFAALKIQKGIGDKNGVADSYGNIGGIYLYQSNFDKALENYTTSLTIYNEINDKMGMARAYGNMGIIYFQQKNFDKALENYLSAQKIFEESNDKMRIGISYVNIGNVYVQKLDFENAIKKTRASIKIFEEIGSKHNIAFAYKNLGDIFLRQNKFEESKKLSFTSLSIAKEMGAKDIIRDTYQTLSLCDSALSNWKDAYAHQKLFKQYHDSIFNEESSGKIAEMTTKYETEKKEKAIELLNKNAEITNLQLKRGRVIQYGLGAGVALLAFIGFLVFRQYKAKKKANIQITAEKEKVEQTNKALKSAYHKLQELQGFKESMTGMIVHDLKNPLNSIINFSQVEATRSHLQTINQSGKQMLNMVMNILDVQKFENAAVQLNTVPAALKTVADAALAQVEPLASQKNITIENNISPLINTTVDVELMTRVFVNLLTNAIKYTPPSGKVKIGTEPLTQAKVKVFVSDTGQGIPHDKLSMVFEKFAQVDAKKSGQVSSTGLGLTFCKMAIEAHRETIDVESETGKGTTFYFTMNASEDAAHTTIASTQEEARKKGTLTAEQRTLLQPAIAQLKTLNIYSTGSIVEIAGSINDQGQKEITEWKTEIENAVYNFDEIRYNELLNG